MYWPIVVTAFHLIPFVLSTEYLLDNCQLHSKNDNLIIDFYGKLESQWVADDSWRNSSWYFNLCPKKPYQCPNGGFVCLKVNNKVYDVGSSYEGTVEEDMNGSKKDFKISLKGNHGMASVIIRCDESESPPIIFDLKNGTDSSFELHILWSSSTNCPVKQFLAEDTCILYVKSGSFDLRPLSGTYATQYSRYFIFNLCEIPEKSICPQYVCEKMNSGGILGISNKYKIRYLQGKDLSMIFTTKTEKKIIINFTCSMEAITKKVEFFTQHGDDLIFSLRTPYACQYPKMSCLVQSVKNVAYDITPLHKMMENYELRINKSIKLILNICGPLSFNKYFSCTDGNKNYACLVNQNNHTVSFATDFSDIKEVKPGILSLSYKGKGNMSLFLDIKLICSKHLRTSPNVTKSEIINRISVIWETYTACPMKFSRGKNCEVENLFRNNNNILDLSSLHKKESDYNLVIGNESFRINICGVLNRSCSKNPDAAVCMKKSDGNEIAIGEIGAQEPQFVDGQFIFDLEGEPCRKDVTKTRVKIILACDFSQNVSTLELYPSHEVEGCNFYFYWKTSVVCGLPLMSKCRYSNEDFIYDLSSLRNLQENYVVNYGDSEIELNVCHTLIPGHRTHCPELSGVCLKNNSLESIISAAYKGNNDQNLGIIGEDDNFEIIGNKLRMNYRNGGICLKGGERSSTTFDFYCDKNAFDTVPKFVSAEYCHFYFNWTTSAACPIYKKKSPCTNMDPISGKKIDLSILMEEDIVVQDSNIVLGICRPVSHKGCADKSGACIIQNDIFENVGDFNSDLIIRNSVLLIYNGTNCKSTTIDFRCSDTEDSKPILVKNGYCSKIVVWPTRLACLNDNVVSNCCQGIEELCQKLNKTYEVHVNQTEKVFINVCKPLIPKKGIYCPPSALSCIASHKSSEAFHQEKSLGAAYKSVELNETAVVLEYSNGDLCEKDSTKHYSTSITFICDKNLTDGQPELIGINDSCHFRFIWATSLMCKEKCVLSEENKDMPFLENFLNWDEKVILSDGKESPYILNLCNVSKKCGSHFCELSKDDETWKGFSVNDKAPTFKSTSERIELFYAYTINDTKGDCGVKVDLVCDKKNGRPMLTEKSKCRIHIVWKSQWACVTDYSSEVHSSNIGAWIVLVISLLSVILIIGLVMKLNTRLNLRVIFRSTLGNQGYERVCMFVTLISHLRFGFDSSPLLDAYKIMFVLHFHYFFLKFSYIKY